MNKTLRFVVLIAMATLFTGGRMVIAAPAGVDLSDCIGWNIVVDAAAIPSELYAAHEFQQYFEQATGTRLPIVNDVNDPNDHVYIGAGPAMRASAVGFDVDDFGDEDFRIIVRDQNIAVAGGRPRGTLYGIYTFLEDYLGVRFLTHDHTHIPTLDAGHVVGPLDRCYHPPLGFRWSFYGENSAQPEFATRRRVNTITSDPRLGGKTGRSLISHSFGRQIPSDTYGREHPEYYGEIDGQRRAVVNDDFRDNEPCLTNPDVLKIVTASVLAELAPTRRPRTFLSVRTTTTSTAVARSVLHSTSKRGHPWARYSPSSTRLPVRSSRNFPMSKSARSATGTHDSPRGQSRHGRMCRSNSAASNAV